MDILKAILVIYIMLIYNIGICADFPRVQEYYNTGRIRYIVNGISISATECGKLSKYVLQNLSDDAQSGSFDWSDMNDSRFKKRMFLKECNRLKYELNLMGSNDAN